MQRVGLLNGNNITYDKDISAGILAMMKTSMVISGFGISGSGASAEILPGKALIECTRANGEKVMVFFESTANVPVNMSGNKKVYIVIDQDALDDGSTNAENGTGIGAITTHATTYPTENFVQLYSVSSGTPTSEMPGLVLKTHSIDGGLTIGGVLKQARSADLASATTTDLSTMTGDSGDITGTTTITGFGTMPAGSIKYLTFKGILTLTHHATNLILPNAGANITTAVGDTATMISLGGGSWKCDKYTLASGLPLQANVNIHGASEKTTFSLDDEILIYDVNGAGNKKEVLKTIFGHSAVAGEAITLGDTVYISISDEKAYKTDGTSTSKIQVVGFALNTVTTGQTVYYGFAPKMEFGNIGASSANNNSTTYNSVDSGTNSFGYKITTTKACSIVSVTKSASCTATRAKILDSGGSVIDTATFSGNVATFASPVALSNATVYRVECDKSGASYSWHTKSGSTFNSSTDFNYTAGSHNGGDSNGPSGQTMNSYGFSITSIQTLAYSTTKVPGTTYFVSDLPGKISPTGGTYKSKVGVAITSAIIAFQPQIKDTYIT